MKRIARFLVVLSACGLGGFVGVQVIAAQEKPKVQEEPKAPQLDAIMNWNEVIGVTVKGKHKFEFSRPQAEFTFLPEEDNCEVEVSIPTGSTIRRITKSGAVQKRGEFVMIWKEGAPK